MGILLRVLIIEDSEDDTLLILAELRRGGYDPFYIRVDTADATSYALHDQVWDIVLSDYQMPRFSGFAALRLFKESGLDIPFIIVSGNIGEDIAVDAMRTGAQDYIMKGNLARLVPAINRELTEAAFRRDKAALDQSLKQSEERYSRIVNTAYEGIWSMDADQITTFVNPRMAEMLGYRPTDMIGRPVDSFMFEADIVDHAQEMEMRHVGSQGKYERHFRCADGSELWCIVSATAIVDDQGHFCGSFAMFTDITERKRIETERQTVLDLLRLINTPKDFRETIRAVVEYLQKWTGCEAVGIRIRDGNDYPYYETHGFSKDFVLMENRLCRLDENGEIVYDVAGKPYLECMCGNILQGRVDQDKPFFTVHGSFWSNSTTELLASTTEVERQTTTRNHCNAAGYESVALIPLRYGEETMGLIQLNDKRTGRFTEELIGYVERLSDNITSALMEKRAREALRESEDRYRSLVENTPDVIMRFDRQHRHVFVNPAVQAAMSFAPDDFIGKTHREMGFQEDMCRYWEVFLDEVFRSGNPVETEFSVDGKNGPIEFDWRLIPEKDSSGEIDSVLSISRDITDRRKAEREYAQLFASLSDGLALHEIILDETGQPADYRFLSVNPAFEQLTGLVGDEIVGKTVLEVLPKTESIWIERYGRVALTGESVRFEEYSAELDKYYEISAYCPLRGQFAAMFRDITDRKRSEQEKRQFYRDTIKSVTQGKLDLVMIEEVRDYLDSSAIEANLASPAETQAARHKIVGFLASSGLDGERLDLFETAVGEAMTNAIKHAECGDVFAGIRGGSVWVAVRDHGPGISALTLPGATLRRGYSTKASMGMGYSIMMEASDEIMLCTGPEGTTVILSIEIVATKLEVSLDDIPDTWGEPMR